MVFCWAAISACHALLSSHMTNKDDDSVCRIIQKEKPYKERTSRNRPPTEVINGRAVCSLQWLSSLCTVCSVCRVAGDQAK